jgi:predicted phage tail protein
LISKNIKIKGSGGGGSSSPDPPYEAPNTLRSRSTARILDIVSEGEIEGLQNGLKGVYLDEVAVQNDDFFETYNFEGVEITERVGTTDQEPMYMFEDGIPSETYLGYELEYNVPRVVPIASWTGDYVKLKFRVPSLVKNDSSSGDLLPNVITIDVEYSLDGGTYQSYGTVTIRGKCVSEYERQIRIENLTGYSSISIRCTKTTRDTDAYNQRTAYWYSYTEVIAQRLIYPDSAYFGVKVNAELFGNHIPSRAYHLKGLKINVPDNYDPETRVYTGTWSGSFQTAWTDNPAWVFYDLLTNDRYGLGVSSTYSNSLKWLLYSIAQYCDALVDDGYSGTEPRFTCNCVINTREEAFHVIHTMASIFNAMPFWGPGQVYIAQDKDSDPTRLVTPSNVEGGKFNYEGTGLKARHTVAIVTWNDPNDFYRQAQELVENRAGIDRYGWREVEVTAYGCTSRGQAHRCGKWILESDLSQKETVTYTAGWDHVDCLPGEVIQIADPAYGEVRHGGRLVTPGVNTVTIDAEFEFDPAGTYSFSVVMDDMSIETVDVANPGTTTNTFNLADSLSEEPKVGSVWLLTETTDLVARKWRVVSVNETSKGKFSVTAVYHDADKFDRIDVPEFDPVPDPWIPIGMPDPPTNFATQEYTYMSGQSHLFGLMLSWEHPGDSRVSYYQLQWRPEDGAYSDLGNVYENSYDFKPVVAGSYYFRVRSVSLSGWSSWLESDEVEVTATVAALPAVSNLEVVGGGTSWSTPDLEIEWDSILDIYYADDISTVLRDYRIDVYTTADVLLRTDYVDRSNPRYTYTKDMNTSDGGPRRSVKITVRARDVYENLSPATTQTFSNPAPDMSSISLTIIDIFKGVFISWDSWVEPSDMLKYAIYVGKNQSLVESLDSSTYQGDVSAGTKRYTVPGLDAEDTYYVVVVPYDTFGIGTETNSSTGIPEAIGLDDLDTELSSSIEITDSESTADLSSLYDGITNSGGINYGVQNWGWVQYAFPVETLIDRVYYVASNHQINVYIAYSDDGTTWSFLKADADHTIDSTGKMTAATNEADAQTNYYTSTTTDRILLPFPNRIVGRYARIYFTTTDAGFYLREVEFVRQVIAEQVLAESLSAIVADLGLVTAGVVQSSDYDGSTQGMMIDSDNRDIKIIKDSDTKFEYDGATGDLQIKGVVTFLSTSSGYANLTDAPTSLNDISSTEYGRASDPAARINNQTTTIDGGKITTGSITATQIDSGTITANEIASGTITADEIGAGEITATHIGTNEIIASAANIANAVITGAKIASATITGAKITDATIENAKIANLTIGTTKIANNAITTIQSAFTQAGTAISKVTEGTIQSVSITTTGGDLVIIFSFDCVVTDGGYDTNGWFNLYRGTTQLSNDILFATDASEDGVNCAATYQEAPSAGTYTYYVKAFVDDGSNMNAQHRSIVVMEMKK